jgi:glycosyltransferase involved in cell wall biosynthesis
MKIGMDIRSLQTESGYRGIGRYTRELAEQLLMLGENLELEFYACGRRPKPEVGQGVLEKMIPLKHPVRMTTLWDQLFWPRFLRERGVDLFHATEFALPFLFRGKKVITVHDLIPLTAPSHMERSIANTLVYRFRYASLKTADRIIAVSNTTKNDLVRMLGVRPDRIEVIHQGVPDKHLHFQDQKTAREIKERYHIQHRYFLYVGGFDSRKNIAGLFDVFRLLRDRVPDTQLVLVGKAAGEDLQYLIDRKGLEGAVIRTGYVPDEDLIRLYRHAEGLLFLSLSEGFGLPALEAMAAGTPVIYSRGTSLQEVVKDSGIDVDPGRPPEISRCLVRLLTDPSYKDDLGRKGRKRAETLTWSETARKTMALYRALLKKKKGGAP